ncbi:MAG: DUF4276 family protein [Gammaproteobacteria bacterium]|nr:DUF4276 family protein [Gammaproteobacteria bacterium]MYE28706.1 DUF4276 family protein [Gammaproteobacteria bacterium]
MSSYVEVVVLTEGRTEQLFIKRLLAPYMGLRGVYLTPVQLDKPGQKGGDVRFARAKNDIARHLKQRNSTYVSLLVDYYGIGGDWPGLDAVRAGAMPSDIASVIGAATQEAVDAELADYRSNARFVPHVSVHEFEALLFSKPDSLAKALQVDRKRVDAIIEECGEPEAIDNSPQTAPSARIAQLYSRFKKTSTGIAIARSIGIEQMRSMCPVFNGWLGRLESLAVGA